MQVVLACSSGENSQQIAFFLAFKENFLNVKKREMLTTFQVNQFCTWNLFILIYLSAERLF